MWWRSEESMRQKSFRWWAKISINTSSAAFSRRKQSWQLNAGLNCDKKGCFCLPTGSSHWGDYTTTTLKTWSQHQRNSEKIKAEMSNHMVYFKFQPKKRHFETPCFHLPPWRNNFNGFYSVLQPGPADVFIETISVLSDACNANLFFLSFFLFCFQ